jgi:amino acid transporter
LLRNLADSSKFADSEGLIIQSNHSIHRQRKKDLGILELVAIALGGMIGGGIFTILGVSVSMIGVYTPLAIVFGGGVAALAAYSYVKLSVYYQDEGATYSFFKRTFSGSPVAASLIGWWVVFGYISTVALYAYTFASYAISGTTFSENDLVRKVIAAGVIGVFALINIWSVKGMGKIEDVMVYLKLIILAVISLVLLKNGNATIPQLFEASGSATIIGVLTVASITFVAYEGFQLVISATNEVDEPSKKIPRAIYTSVGIVVVIYLMISLGAIMAIPFSDLIANQEYALASGASQVLGPMGNSFVIFGALLATSSAISGTLFGASRLITVVAADGFFPKFLARRSGRIPVNAIVTMSGAAVCLIAAGDLRVILEFGSVTFLILSLLMAVANFKMRRLTHSSSFLTVIASVILASSVLLIIYYEATTQPEQLVFIVGIYLLLSGASLAFANKNHALSKPD